MRSSVSPSARPLSHQSATHLFHGTELQGRCSKRAYQENSTLGKWENLIGKSEIRTPNKRNTADNSVTFGQSPCRVQNEPYRFSSSRPAPSPSPFQYASNDNVSRPDSSTKSSNASNTDYYAGRPSKWGNVMNKTLCVDTTQGGGIRVFRDRSAESPFEKTAERKPLVAYSASQNTWNSHISALPCTTYAEPKIPMVSSPGVARRRQVESPLMVHPENLKFEGEVRANQRALTADQKERKEVKTTYVRCVNMTAKNENVVVDQNKRDHNKQSHASFFADEGRLNPNSRGKRMHSPEYVKRDSALDSEKFVVQPFDKLSKGVKKFEYRSLSGYVPTAKPAATVETCIGKGKAVFSYMKFASQIKLKHNS